MSLVRLLLLLMQVSCGSCEVLKGQEEGPTKSTYPGKKEDKKKR